MTRLRCKLAGRRGGFTLLEVLLALGLGVLVMVAIGIAIDVHLRAVNAGRRHVEQGQLARAVLSHIANDLRGALRYQPFDASALTNTTSQLDSAESMLDSVSSELQSAAGALGGSGGGSTGGNQSTGGSGSTGGGRSTGSGNGGNSSGDSAGSGSKSAGSSTTISGSDGSTTSDSDEQTTTVPAPGIYGLETELHIDVSRLPRVDERLSGPQLGDVKTVSYYVSALSSGEGSGLVRRAVDRAGTLWSADQGAPSGGQAGELIAPEVVGIEFQYFDGTEWTSTWDSTARAGLPLAVEVAIAVASGSGRSAPSGSLFSTDPTSESSGVFRLLVQLPAAEVKSASSTSTESTGEEEAL